jgi:hypothetical protein
MEASIGGVSTRKVGCPGSRPGGAERHLQVAGEPSPAGVRYGYLDTTHLNGCLDKALRVCSRAVVVERGVNADGRRELLGLKVGDSKNQGFWSEFISW